jgi:hypothetical protein
VSASKEGMCKKLLGEFVQRGFATKGENGRFTYTP